MIKKINNNLCRDVLNSDFFILTQNNKNLNVISVLKSLKQFIRIFFFLKLFKTGDIIFNLKKSNDFFLIKNCLNSLQSCFGIKIYSKTKILQSHKLENRIKIFFNFNALIEKNLKKKVLNDGISLLLYIGLKNKTGFYVVKNRLDNLKKKIFLLSLIKKILL